MNPDPCTKGMGYLSIEKAKDVPIVVYRTLTGSIHFQGIMNKNGAKYKVLTESDDPKNANKFKLKFTVAVKGKQSDANAEKPKPWYVIEHC